MVTECKLCELGFSAVRSQIRLRIKGFEHSVGRRPSAPRRPRRIFGSSPGSIEENFRRSRRVGRVDAESEQAGTPPVPRRPLRDAIWPVRPPKFTGFRPPAVRIHAVAQNPQTRPLRDTPRAAGASWRMDGIAVMKLSPAQRFPCDHAFHRQRPAARSQTVAGHTAHT